MKIRVMGTRAECEAFGAMARETVDPALLRSISRWYPNRRSAYSNEGRIYIDVDLPQDRRSLMSDRLMHALNDAETII